MSICRKLSALQTKLQRCNRSNWTGLEKSNNRTALVTGIEYSEVTFRRRRQCWADVWKDVRGSKPNCTSKFETRCIPAHIIGYWLVGLLDWGRPTMKPWSRLVGLSLHGMMDGSRHIDTFTVCSTMSKLFEKLISTWPQRSLNSRHHDWQSSVLPI